MTTPPKGAARDAGGGQPDSLSSHVAIVTGAASGLGLAMAEALYLAGAGVVIADRNGAGAKELAGRLGERALGVEVDVSSESDVERVVAATTERFGRLDVVVNNAGIGMGEVRGGDRYSDPIRLAEVTPDHLRRFFAVHVLGSFLMMRAALPIMVEAGWGRIVTVTTSLGTMIRSGNAPYGPMKAASEAFTSIAAGDHAGSGVTANVLVPGGGADTPMVPEVPGRSRANLVAPTTMGPPIVWLAGHGSDGVTGRRFIAKLWDAGLPPAEAAEAASFPIAWPGES